jgi:hypothetical protein
VGLEDAVEVALFGAGAGYVDGGWVECGGVETPGAVGVLVDVVAVTFDWGRECCVCGLDGGGGEEGETAEGEQKECVGCKGACWFCALC